MKKVWTKSMLLILVLLMVSSSAFAGEANEGSLPRPEKVFDLQAGVWDLSPTEFTYLEYMKSPILISAEEEDHAFHFFLSTSSNTFAVDQDCSVKLADLELPGTGVEEEERFRTIDIMSNVRYALYTAQKQCRILIDDGRQVVLSENYVCDTMRVNHGHIVIKGHNKDADGPGGWLKVGSFDDFIAGEEVTIDFEEFSAVKAYGISADGQILYVCVSDNSDNSSVLVKIDMQTREQKEIYQLPGEIQWGIYHYLCDVRRVYEKDGWIYFMYSYGIATKFERLSPDGTVVDQAMLEEPVMDVELTQDDRMYILTGRDDIHYRYYPTAVYQMDWPPREAIENSNGQEAADATQAAGRMKPIVKERSKGGLTVAEAVPHGVGAFHPENDDGEKIRECALLPVRSEESELVLRIALEDLQEALARGCSSVDLRWKDSDFVMPLDAERLAEWGQMVADDEAAWIEWTLSWSEDGVKSRELQLAGRERVSESMTLVHRYQVDWE